MKPQFIPGCRRLTPGPGFLEALVQDNVQLIQTAIFGVTGSTIVTNDGKK